MKYSVRPVAVGMLPRGSAYTVKDLGDSIQGYVDLVKREIGVSRNADAPHTRFIQLHEQGHIMWSKHDPRKLAEAAGLDPRDPDSHALVNAAEDARNNARLLRAVPDAHEGFALAPRTVLRNDLPGYMSSYRAPEVCRAKIRKALEAQGKGEQCDRIDAECERLEAGGKLTSSSMTVPLIRFLHEVMTEPDKPEPEEPEEKDEEEEEGEPGDEPEEKDGDEPGDEPEEEEPGDEPTKDKGDDEEEKSEGEEIKDKGDEDEKEEDASDDEEFGRDDADDDTPWSDTPILPEDKGDTNTQWCIPEVVTPPLRVTVQRPGTHSSMASDSGVLIRDICRIATDGQVFGRSRMRPGTVKRGTFLIDASGSMGLTNADLEEIINAVPSATVAIYSGSPSREAKNARAWVTIVAKDGKRANFSDKEVKRGGGNMCDGPALLWLSRQTGPRFWYCDNGTTNYADSVSVTLQQECALICEAAHIKHINPHSEPFVAGKDGRWAHGTVIVNAMRRMKIVR